MRFLFKKDPVAPEAPSSEISPAEEGGPRWAEEKHLGVDIATAAADLDKIQHAHQWDPNLPRGRLETVKRAIEGGDAADIAEAVRGADVVLTMLPDSPDVEGVVLGEGRPPSQPRRRRVRQRGSHRHGRPGPMDAVGAAGQPVRGRTVGRIDQREPAQIT